MTLPELLATMPYRDLRGTATRLQLRLDRQHQKRDWIPALVTGWQSATTRHQWLAQLSVTAREAMTRLLAAEQIPAPLFWAEYGPVRQVTANQHWTPPPWQAPATVSEELYYSGLLCPTPRPLARAQVVSLPVDLQDLLADEETRYETGDTRYEIRDARHETREDIPVSLSPVTLPPVSLSPVSLSPVSLSPVSLSPVSLSPVSLSPVTLPPPGWPLCHDVGQLLIYLPTEAGGRLLQGRWLSRTQCVALNERLLAPVAMASITSHRRTPYLRLLMFLATVGDLQQQGEVTPAGWQWLAAAPAAQLAWLQQRWLTATPADRQAYALPDGAVARPWPQPLAHHLNSLAARDAAAAFTAGDLMHGLLRAEQPVAAFWGANFHSLTDLETVVARLLVEVLQPVGLVAPQAADHAPVTSWLACAPVDPLVIATDDAPPSHPAQLQSAAAAYDLYLPAGPATGRLAAQAQISRYGHYQPPASRTTAAFHHYQLTPATLAAAAAAGHGLATLNAALTTVGLALTPTHYATLAAWHEQGRQLTIQHLPLLRSRTPAQLAALLQNPTIRAALGEVLAPTAALLTGAPAIFAQLLQQQGYAVATGMGAATTTSEDAATGALWLAGRLYAALGDHLPLPLPLPFGALDQLLARLPATAQAALQAQWLPLHEQLLTLLDNLPYTPPPQPSDPAQWRPLITQAIDANQLLRLTYHSAGRNLTTERLVQPYWIEEHRGIPYLRAYCHNAGRVLTFRLDRIAAVTG